MRYYADLTDGSRVLFYVVKYDSGYCLSVLYRSTADTKAGAKDLKTLFDFLRVRIALHGFAQVKTIGRIYRKDLDEAEGTVSV